MIYYLIYSLSLIAVWGLLFLSADRPGLIGVFIGMLYTFYSSYFIRQFISKEKTLHISLKMLGPIVYLLAMLFMLPFGTHIILSPISLGFLIILFTSFDRNTFPRKHIQFFVVFFLYLYSFTLFNSWWKINSLLDKKVSPVYDFEEKKNTPPNKSILNLADQYFITSTMDSILIGQHDKYTLVETWNEKCPPCLKAFPAMRPVYDSLESELSQYYVYIPNIELEHLNTEKVFNFERIEEKDRILIDVDLQQKASLTGYPYFLLFNPEGELIFIHKGFNPAKKNALVEEIVSNMKSQKTQ